MGDREPRSPEMVATTMVPSERAECYLTLEQAHERHSNGDRQSEAPMVVRRLQMGGGENTAQEVAKLESAKAFHAQSSLAFGMSSQRKHSKWVQDWYVRDTTRGKMRRHAQMLEAARVMLRKASPQHEMQYKGSEDHHKRDDGSLEQPQRQLYERVSDWIASSPNPKLCDRHCAWSSGVSEDPHTPASEASVPGELDNDDGRYRLRQICSGICDRVAIDAGESENFNLSEPRAQSESKASDARISAQTTLRQSVDFESQGGQATEPFHIHGLQDRSDSEDCDKSREFKFEEDNVASNPSKICSQLPLQEVRGDASCELVALDTDTGSQPPSPKEDPILSSQNLLEQKSDGKHCGGSLSLCKVLQTKPVVVLATRPVSRTPDVGKGTTQQNEASKRGNGTIGTNVNQWAPAQPMTTAYFTGVERVQTRTTSELPCEMEEASFILSPTSCDSIFRPVAPSAGVLCMCACCLFCDVGLSVLVCVCV